MPRAGVEVFSPVSPGTSVKEHYWCVEEYYYTLIMLASHNMLYFWTTFCQDFQAYFT